MFVLPMLCTALAASPDSSGTLRSARFQQPGPTPVDLLRVVEGGPRIYVRAQFPDGSRGLFMVDTGADISVLLPATAERLGLEMDEEGGTIIGLGGISQTDRTVLPSLAFGANGETVVDGIEMAVGVPGMAETAGAMPLDGLLGNNVWSRFVLELDYPADLMVLHPPSSVHLKPKHTRELYFDGSHVFGAVELRTKADPSTLHQITLPIDTGAGELSFCGRGLGITESWSAGLEPVMGLGSSSSLPFFRNLRMTRRIELAEVRLGGQKVAISSARWMDFEGAVGCGNDLPGLAGHELLEGHRVFFDYGNGALQLSPSRRKPRSINGHRVLLAEENGQGPYRALYRAKLHLFLDEMDASIVELRRALEQPEDADEARVLLAALLQEKGDLDGAWALLRALPPGALVEEQEIGAMVNGLMFRDQRDEAMALAEAAVAARPDAAAAWVALSDARIWNQDWEGAHQALQEGVALEKHPDAYLLRRARLAMLAGDRHASMAHLRKFLQLYPMGGEAIWFYASLVDSEASGATFLADLDHAMERLHPSSRPLDFLVAAHHQLGDETAAQGFLDEGIDRDCEPAEREARDNCLAWYWSLAGVRPDPALVRIERALQDGERSDYLDTLAVVRLSRGELALAHEAALAAARRAPDNVYMLWQVDRLERLLREES